ncbi:hypothetical protein, partial [Parvimonas sp. D9]|uniref:hypothetical protein n=1 Tax=Parvimonas sp. D9 TaxID=3110689 RepID=UPI002B4AA664
ASVDGPIASLTSIDSVKIPMTPGETALSVLFRVNTLNAKGYHVVFKGVDKANICRMGLRYRKVFEKEMSEYTTTGAKVEDCLDALEGIVAKWEKAGVSHG